MKKILLACLLLAASGPSILQGLRYAPEEDLTITHTFEAISESSMVSATLEVDGEIVQEVSEEDLEGALERSSTERIQLSDAITRAEDGQVIEFTRSFVELLQESEESAGENERSSTATSDLESIDVDFVWDEDEEAYTASFSDEDCELDPELLEQLSADLDLVALLPDDEVEEGDEWELEDPAAYLPLMWPSGLLGFHDEDAEGFSEEARADNAQIIDNLELSCAVTYEGEDERDGTRVALLSVSMEIASEIENDVEPDEGPEFVLRVSIERSIEGEVLWDLDHNHLFSASFEGDLETSIAREATVTNPETDEELEVVDTKVIQGTITYTVGVERE